MLEVACQVGECGACVSTACRHVSWTGIMLWSLCVGWVKACTEGIYVWRACQVPGHNILPVPWYVRMAVTLVTNTVLFLLVGPTRALLLSAEHPCTVDGTGMHHAWPRCAGFGAVAWGLGEP